MNHMATHSLSVSEIESMAQYKLTLLYSISILLKPFFPLFFFILMTFTTTTVAHLSPSPRQPPAQSFTCAEKPKIQLKSNLPSPQDLPSITTPRHKALYSTLLDGLCHLILYTLQLGYLLYIACRSLYRKTEHVIRQCLDTSDRLVAIHKDKARLTKIPKHLAILISGELEERDFADWEDLVNDICLTSCWAWEFGIQELSVYDPSGKLDDKKEKEKVS